MSLLRTFDTGMRGLLGHRLRSILTTLGILFGVAAVICTVGIGTASANSVNARIASLGTNLLTVSPGSTVSFGVRGGGVGDVVGLKQELIRFGVCGPDRVCAARTEQDPLHRIGAAAGDLVLGGGEGNHREVITVGEAGAPDRGEDADHLEGVAGDAHLVPDDGAESGRGGRAEDDDLSVLLHFRLREEDAR